MSPLNPYVRCGYNSNILFAQRVDLAGGHMYAEYGVMAVKIPFYRVQQADKIVWVSRPLGILNMGIRRVSKFRIFDVPDNGVTRVGNGDSIMLRDSGCGIAGNCRINIDGYVSVEVQPEHTALEMDGVLRY